MSVTVAINHSKPLITHAEHKRVHWTRTFGACLFLFALLGLKLSLSFSIQETRYSLEQSRDLHHQLNDELSELQYQRQILTAQLFTDSTARGSAFNQLGLYPESDTGSKKEN